MAEWTRHGLLAGLGLQAPGQFGIDAYWHFLTLPGPRGAAGETLASFVLRFADAETFRRFKAFATETGLDAGPLDIPDFELDEVFAEPRCGEGYEIAGVALPGAMRTLVEGLTGEWSGDRDWGQIISGVHAVGAPLHPLVPRWRPGPGSVAGCMLSPRPRPDTIVAIIDTDIAFGHERFRRQRSDPATPSTETRIAWFWDMDADCRDGQGLPIGREMFAARAPSPPAGVDPDRYAYIDEMLAASVSGGAVDETALYARYGAESRASPGRRRPMRARGHGTMVLDIAAGAPPTDFPASGLTDDTAIFAVQLPRIVVEQTHGAFLSAYIQLALDRIEHMVETWAGDGAGKVVVNLSFGGGAGRHDGASQLEIDFDRRLSKGRGSGPITGICLPAGNGHEARSHARLTGADLRRERTLTMRVQPGDGTPNFAQVWLPRLGDDAAALSALRLEVRPPWGPPLRLNTSGETAMRDATFWEMSGDGGELLARVYVQLDAWPPGDVAARRLKITLAVHHTAQHHEVPGHGAGEPRMAGNWQLTLSSDALAEDAEVMVWIERDDDLPGAGTRARQSYFVRTETNASLAPRREDPDAFGLRRDGTISNIATGRETTVVGAQRRSDARMARYSGRGLPSSAFGARDPTASAPGETSPSLPEILGAGTFSGSVTRASGTSIATAFATRIAAGQMPAGRARDTVRTRAGVEEAAIAKPDLRFATRPDSTDRGHGRLTSVARPGTPPRRDP